MPSETSDSYCLTVVDFFLNKGRQTDVRNQTNFCVNYCLHHVSKDNRTTQESPHHTGYPYAKKVIFDPNLGLMCIFCSFEGSLTRSNHGSKHSKKKPS